MKILLNCGACPELHQFDANAAVILYEEGQYQRAKCYGDMHEIRIFMFSTDWGPGWEINPVATKATGTYVYECSPIDFWDGWGEVSDGLTPSSDRFYYDMDGVLKERDSGASVAFEKARQVAVKAIKAVGWEGDGDWRYSALPNPDDCTTLWMFAVKQSNNGTTFVWSPWELPWLSEYRAYPGKGS